MSSATNDTILIDSERRNFRSYSEEIDRILADRQDWHRVAAIEAAIDQTVQLMEHFKAENTICSNEFAKRSAKGDLGGLNSLRRESEELYEKVLSAARTLESTAFAGEAAGYTIRGLALLQTTIVKIEMMKAEFFRGWRLFEPNCNERAHQAMTRGETLSLEEVFGGLPG